MLCMMPNVFTEIRRRKRTQKVKLKLFVRENKLFTQTCFKSCCFFFYLCCLFRVHFHKLLPFCPCSDWCLYFVLLCFCFVLGGVVLGEGKVCSFCCFYMSVSNLAIFYTYTLVPCFGGWGKICCSQSQRSQTLYCFISKRVVAAFFGSKRKGCCT